MSHHSTFFSKCTIAVAAFVFVFPLAVRADEFSSVDLSPVGKMTLTAQVSGFAAKGSSVDAPPNAPITLAWTMPTGWKGCYSNWDSTLITASGNKTATIPAISAYSKGRAFILTCFGVGQAQSLKVVVNIVKPDIAVASFTGTAIQAMSVRIPGVLASAPGVTPVVKAKDAVESAPIRNTYYAGTPGGATPGGVTFKAILKNTGRSSVPATPAVMVAYEAAQTTTPTAASTVWQKMNGGADVGLEANYAIAPGATPNVATYVHTAGAGGPWYFRVKADSTGVVDEASETNNTRIIGPYIFVDR